MKDERKTKEQLIDELVELRQRITELEKSEAQRERAEQRIRESEEGFRSIFESVNDGMAYVDRSGSILEVNEKAVQLFGGSKEELMGKHFTKLGILSPRDIPMVVSSFASILAGKKPTLDLCITSKKGEEIYLECSATVVKREAQVVGVIVIARDITENKRAEEEIRRHSEELATLNAIAMTVTSTLDLQEVLQTMQETVMGLLDEPYPPIFFLLNEGGQNFQVAATRLQEEGLRRVEELTGVNLEELSLPLSTVKPALREALLAGRPHMTNDLSDLSELGTSRRLFKDAQRALEIKSIVGLPLWAKGKLTGMVLLASQKERIPDEEMESLFAIASHAAIAIENARLYEAAQQELAERKRAEEALRESEERFRTIVETAPSLLLVCDAEGKNIYVSPNCEEIAGYTQEELLGRMVWWVHEDDTPRAKEVYDRTFREGVGCKALEYKAVKKNGELWYASSSWEPLKDAEGKLEGVVFQTIDITERKRAEEALRESEERYHSLFDGVPVGLYRTTPEGQIVDANPALMRMLGYPDRQALLAANATDLYVDPEDRRREQALVEREGVVRDFEMQLRRHDGTIIWVRDSARAVRDGDGRVLYYGGSVEDMTERKRAQEIQSVLFHISQATTVSSNLDELLAVIHQQLGRLIDTTNFYVALYDEENDLYSLPYYVDQYDKPDFTRQQIRKSVTDYVRRTWAPLLKDEDVREQLIQKGEVEQVGAPAPIWLGVPLRSAEGVIGVVAVQSYEESSPYSVQDLELLTFVSGHVAMAIERKRAEEEVKEYSERLEEMVEERTKELRQAQEELIRKERLAILGQLAGGVAHELRNPLGVISNAIYYLNTTLPDADETTKEYLEIISSEVHNSEKIVLDLLDLSRTRPAEREEIAVSELVAQVLEKEPPPEKVKVTTRIASDLPPVFVDPGQIGEVLINLVANAYQAMPQGGRLTISAQAEKGQVYLSITDTGCGISKENMKMLFEPLFTTKAKGIGLGLAVSKNLVEVNGGSIEVESEEGKGSIFTIILPTKEAQA